MITYIPEYAVPGQISVLESEIEWLNVQDRRGECFMSDTPLNYKYLENGPVYKSIEMHPLVKLLMLQINCDYGYNLNVCFLNYYIDAWKALGWHADDAIEINQSQPICVISYGQEREIWWKEKGYKGDTPVENRQLLGDGSLFVMPPGMQDTHFHRIPKGDKIMSPRISLTYRSWKDI